MHHRHAGDIAARPRQAGNQPLADRVAGQSDNRNCRVDTLGRADHQLAERDDDIRSEPRQLCREIGNAIPPTLGEAIVNDDVLALDIAELV